VNVGFRLKRSDRQPSAHVSCWHIASLRYAAIRRLSRHSGLWRGVGPANLWVHGLVLSDPSVHASYDTAGKLVYLLSTICDLLGKKFVVLFFGNHFVAPEVTASVSATTEIRVLKFNVGTFLRRRSKLPSPVFTFICCRCGGKNRASLAAAASEGVVPWVLKRDWWRRVCSG
jgi:hypothetical protein